MPIRVGKAGTTSVSFTTPQEIVISQSDDSIAVYGTDGSVNRQLRTNSQGNLITESSQAVYAVLTDEVGSTIYVGEALPGTGLGTAAWRIKRIVDNSGDLTTTWADGDANFDNVWNNRLSLSYS